MLVRRQLWDGKPLTEMQRYMGRQGNRLDRGVTLRDLRDAGIIDVSKTYLVGGGGSTTGSGGKLPSPIPPGGYYPDPSPPPMPTGFSASTSKVQIQVVTNPPTFPQGHGHQKTIIYGAMFIDGDPLPTFGDAVVLTEFPGDVHAFPVDPAAQYRLWAVWVSKDGGVSQPAGGINGIEAIAGLLDDANIASLTASKIRAGAIAVGEHIQSSNYVPNTSGWRINGNGVAELSDAIVRGGIYAAYGYVGGITVGEHSISSTNFDAGAGTGFELRDDGTLSLPDGSISAAKLNVDSLEAVSAVLGDVNAGSVRNGDFTGYGWPAAGGTGFYLGPAGLLMGNFNDGQYVDIRANGNMYLPGMKVEDGTLYFQQAAAINTANIVIGAVVVGTSSSGNDDVSIVISVPPGETYSILIVASFLQSTFWPVASGAAPDDLRSCSLDADGVEVLPDQAAIETFVPIAGVSYYFGPATMFRSLSLPAGTYTIRAVAAYVTGGGGVYITPIYVVAYMFKR